MAPTPRKDEQDKTKPPTPAKRPAKGEPAAKPKEEKQKKGGTRVNYTGPEEDGPELGGGTDQFLTR